MTKETNDWWEGLGKDLEIDIEVLSDNTEQKE